MDILQRNKSFTSRMGWLSLVLGAVALVHCTALAQASQASVSPRDNPDDKVSEATPPLERIVSLIGEPTTRRAALRDICRQAGIALRLDDDALAAAGLKLDET